MGLQIPAALCDSRIAVRKPAYRHPSLVAHITPAGWERVEVSHLLRLWFCDKLAGMSHGVGVEGARAPLFGVGGLLGVTMMVLLLVAFPEVRWFALFSIPLGILMAACMRLWREFEERRDRRMIWTRDVPHFRWPEAA